MTLNFLGRGSAFNIKEGNTAAYIKEKNILFLIDCGSNIFERIISSNLLDDVKDVYVAITHRHPDHIGSLGDLIFYCFYNKGIKVQIFDSGDSESLVKYLLLCGVTEDKYDLYYHVGILEIGLSLYFEETEHTEIYKCYYNGNTKLSEENIFPCYNIILNYKNKNIFYSGDTQWIDFACHDFEDEYYVDCCIANYDWNVHYNVNKIYKDCIDSKVDLSKVYCMHFDSSDAINRAKELGFNIVKTLKQ